jgi:hypothetical protein
MGKRRGEVQGEIQKLKFENFILLPKGWMEHAG